MKNRNLLTASEVAYLRAKSGGEVYQSEVGYGGYVDVVVYDTRVTDLKVKQRLLVGPARLNKLLLGYLDFMACMLDSRRGRNA